MTTSVLDRTNPFVVRDQIPMPVAGDQPVNARAARTDAYAIHVTRTLEDTVARLVGLLDGAQVALLTDEVVMALHGGKLLDALDGSGIDVQASVMPAGERSKCLEQAGRAWDWLAASSIGRRDVLLAFGGGVINDTGGWIASGYMRGIPYINVPTTDISPSTAFREPPRARASGTSSGIGDQARACPTAPSSRWITPPTRQAWGARRWTCTTSMAYGQPSPPRATSRARRSSPATSSRFTPSPARALSGTWA
jgi:hypothetical protein